MATLDVPNRYLDIGPLIVTSPTTRCGTTFVQRLLTASDNAFVYGEEVGNQIKTLTDLFLTIIRLCEADETGLNESFRRAHEGTPTDWRPGLAPPAPVMLKAWTETYYQLPHTLAAFGGQIGRPVWGFKWPACPTGTLSAIRSFMPRTRVIYVLRNPVDALKSAKARKFVRTLPEASAFCAAWASHLGQFLALPQSEQALWLRYEDLMADRDGQVARIEAFSGARGVRRAVFGVRVNTFAGEAADGHSPTQYIEPEALTDDELAAVRERAGELWARFYPDQAAQAC